MTWLLPNAEDKAEEIGVDPDGNPVEVAVKEDAAPVAIVFKTVGRSFCGETVLL